MSTAVGTGLDRLAAAFARARDERRLALVAYLMAGHPDLATSARLARAALDAGADVLELGVPFSDPLADGTTIQRAAERALANGTRLADVLALPRGLPSAAAVLLMGYTNPFLRYGLERLARDTRAAGVAGLIVPDLPREESGELAAFLEREGQALVTLVAPTTPDDRLAELVSSARGFVYCVSLTGVTGARPALPPDVAGFVGRVRAHARIPVVVGFGVARPEHVAALRGVADGVVVGSALVDAIAGAADPVAALSALVSTLRRACG